MPSIRSTVYQLSGERGEMPSRVRRCICYSCFDILRFAIFDRLLRRICRLLHWRGVGLYPRDAPHICEYFIGNRTLEESIHEGLPILRVMLHNQSRVNGGYNLGNDKLT